MPKDNNTKKEIRSWIFLRGLARHSVHWGPFIDVFKKHFPNDEIELLDLRGNGEFADSPSFVSVEANVKDLRARSKFLKAGKKVHLLTISFGSMVGTEWAELYPEDLESLTIMNTSDRKSSYFFDRLRPQNYTNILKLVVQGKDQQSIEKNIMSLVTNAPEKYKDWTEKFSQHRLTSKSNFTRQIIAASSYHFPDHKPKTDVLILASEKDHLVNSACSKRIAEMWKQKAHFHPTAGHDIPLEDPEWVCEELERWMDCVNA